MKRKGRRLNRADPACERTSSRRQSGLVFFVGFHGRKGRLAGEKREGTGAGRSGKGGQKAKAESSAKTISMARLSSRTARRLAATSRAVSSGDPNATSSAWIPSKSPSAFRARLKFGIGRLKGSATTR